MDHEDSDDLSCCVCLDPLLKPLRYECNHFVCEGCFAHDEGLMSRCPLCRRPSRERPVRDDAMAARAARQQALHKLEEKVLLLQPVAPLLDVAVVRDVIAKCVECGVPINDNDALVEQLLSRHKVEEAARSSATASSAAAACARESVTLLIDMEELCPKRSPEQLRHTLSEVTAWIRADGRWRGFSLQLLSFGSHAAFRSPQMMSVLSEFRVDAHIQPTRSGLGAFVSYLLDGGSHAGRRSLGGQAMALLSNSPDLEVAASAIRAAGLAAIVFYDQGCIQQDRAEILRHVATSVAALAVEPTSLPASIHTGVVGRVRLDKNGHPYTFITSVDGESGSGVFAHSREVIHPAGATLKEGASVSFCISQAVHDSSKTHATAISIDAEGEAATSSASAVSAATLSPPGFTQGIVQTVKRDKNGQQYSFIKADEDGELVFVHSKALKTPALLQRGAVVRFRKQLSGERADRVFAADVGFPRYTGILVSWTPKKNCGVLRTSQLDETIFFHRKQNPEFAAWLDAAPTVSRQGMSVMFHLVENPHNDSRNKVVAVVEE